MSYGLTRQYWAEEQSPLRLGLLVLGVLALLAIPSLVLGGFQTDLLAETLIFVLFATAFNVLYGYTGLLSFGHAMFVAAAGYTVVKVFSQVAPLLGIPEIFGGVSVLVTWLLALLLGVLVATLLAVFVGFLSVRLEEIYFAIITLSFSMAIYVIVFQDTIGSVIAGLGLGDDVFTNGSDGLTFLPGDIVLFGYEVPLVNLTDPLVYYYLTLVVVVVGMYWLWRIVKSPFGLVCKAVRENPERASALGINVRFHRWMAFVISGAFSGLAGALLIPLEGNANPAFAHWTFSAEPVIMTVIGGPYSFLGPAAGAFVHEYLRWGISQFPLLEQYWQFSFGVLLLIVVLFFENGVAGGINRLRVWVGVAQERYREDGAAGVAAFVRATVATYLRWVVAQVRGVGRGIRNGFLSLGRRVQGLFGA
jgi:branched-chain amino acid transport system permease protein